MCWGSGGGDVVLTAQRRHQAHHQAGKQLPAVLWDSSAVVLGQRCPLENTGTSL